MRKKKEEMPFIRNIPSVNTGLTSQEVRDRADNGLSNAAKSKTTKTYWKIFFDNFFTFFSCVLVSIAIFFIICNAGVFAPAIPANSFKFSKFGFLLPLFLNNFIGSIQEIRSKRILEKINIVSKSEYDVRRDKTIRHIISDNIVLDDIVVMHSGQQVPVDMKILSGSLEVNESILTGEADNIKKTVKDKLFAGSFVISGSAECITEEVGNNTYAMKLQSKIKTLTKNKSELMKNIYSIIKVMSVVLVMLVGITVGVLYYKMITWPLLELTWADIVETAATVAVGVIPTGLVLLTSITLAVSIIELSKKKVVIQELYSLENLSRVDTICLDKTGTLTTGNLKIKEIIKINKTFDLDTYMGVFLNALPDQNQTTLALLQNYKLNDKYKVSYVQAFSSDKKMSRVILEHGEDLVLGAPEFVLEGDQRFYLDLANEKAEKGLRVLAFTADGELIALICLTDVIRESAVNTIKFLVKNNVDIKIISGDNPITVSHIAEECGVPNAGKCINMQNISVEEIPNIVKEYTVFGRITPEQKAEVIKALQVLGHNVAMTGDGINDVLALRVANASITFNSATDAAKGLSDVVLLDNSFENVAAVIGQGRRVVNNIQRSAILFLTKTFLISFLALFTIPTQEGLSIFKIENSYILEMVIIALSGFFLSVENTRKPITGSFKSTVYPKAIASGLLCAIAALVSIWCYKGGVFGSGDVAKDIEQAVLGILITISGITALMTLCYPFTAYRGFVMIVAVIASGIMAIAYPQLFLTPPAGGKDLFESITVLLHPFNFTDPANIYQYFTKDAYIVIIVFTISVLPAYILLMAAINWFLNRRLIKKLTNINIIDKFDIKKIIANKNKKKEK